jgi:hypothetical protein
MIGTGGMLRCHPCGDGFLVAPCDDRVDEPIRSAMLEVGLGPPEPVLCVPVVRQDRLPVDVCCPYDEDTGPDGHLLPHL